MKAALASRCVAILLPPALWRVVPRGAAAGCRPAGVWQSVEPEQAGTTPRPRVRVSRTCAGHSCGSSLSRVWQACSNVRARVAARRALSVRAMAEPEAPKKKVDKWAALTPANDQSDDQQVRARRTRAGRAQVARRCAARQPLFCAILSRDSETDCTPRNR